MVEMVLAQEKCWAFDDRLRECDLTVAVVAEHLLLHVVQGRVDDAAVVNARGGLVQAEEKETSNEVLIGVA